MAGEDWQTMGEGSPKQPGKRPRGKETLRQGALPPKKSRLPVPRTRRVTHRQVHAHFGSVEQEDTAVKGGLGSS